MCQSLCLQVIQRISRSLFGGVFEQFRLLPNHLAHIADAAGALGLGAASAENLGRALGPGFDGGADVALADPVAVTDVHFTLFLTVILI